MIETSYFNCPQKGKMLAIFFDNEKEITNDFIKQFTNNNKIDRYIELIYRKDGEQFREVLIKQELENKHVIKEILNCLVRKENIEIEEIE